jgi:hypothetical protein
MSRIKRMAGALMIAGALLNLAPTATAAETETADSCYPITNPVVCLVICTAQNQSVKACGVQMACTDDLPTVCYVLGQVWAIVP